MHALPHLKRKIGAFAEVVNKLNQWPELVNVELALFLVFDLKSQSQLRVFFSCEGEASAINGVNLHPRQCGERNGMFWLSSVFEELFSLCGPSTPMSFI